MTEPDTDPDSDGSQTSGFELSPADLTGTVREIQASLRDRYGCTEATVNADPRDRRGANEFAITKPPKSEVTYQLVWEQTDLAREPDKGPVASHIVMLESTLECVTRNFPEADVSIYAQQDRAKINISLGGNR